ncbi:pilus assembly protein CpaE [Spongisporangium articulatum]|uniref:Pilus assembly protein CpaE n=1 Tax=Spongisporangium articulatum TaxID=3362603 RepID=A0ABW8AMT5_9ACTN
MISVELARRLRDAGVAWEPQPGDRFVVPDKGIDDTVFVVSDMVVEVHETPGGRILGFNGTTEWALDSVQANDVLWLPREGQLRAMLGGRFRRLEAADPGWVVVVERDGQEHREVDGSAESAYARALLAILT